MIKTSTRELSLAEIKEIKQSKRSIIWGLLEGFIFSYLFIFVLLLLSLTYFFENFEWYKEVEFYVFIFILVLAFLFNLKFHFSILKDFPFPPKIPLKNIKAEITIIQSRRAIEREDPEDFGSGFYLAIEEEMTTKTIFLCGQYLYSQKIPNTYIEITRRSDTKEILDVKTKGNYFPPQKIIPPFSDEDWNTENYHEDGEILNVSLEEIE